MKKLLVGLAALAVLSFAAPAQAHHATAAKIGDGTFYVCTSNGVPKKRYNGTTKIHLHKVKPTKKHYRRHACRKVVVKLPPNTIVKVVEVPGPERIVERIVYVEVPCDCPPQHGKPHHKHDGKNEKCRKNDLRRTTGRPGRG